MYTIGASPTSSAPTPLYNSFTDADEFVTLLVELCGPRA
jgi:hypothetical protein